VHSELRHWFQEYISDLFNVKHPYFIDILHIMVTLLARTSLKHNPQLAWLSNNVGISSAKSHFIGASSWYLYSEAWDIVGLFLLFALFSWLLFWTKLKPLNWLCSFQICKQPNKYVEYVMYGNVPQVHCSRLHERCIPSADLLFFISLCFLTLSDCIAEEEGCMATATTFSQ